MPTIVGAIARGDINHRNVLKNRTGFFCSDKHTTILLQALRTRLMTLFKNLAGCVKHLGDLAAARFFACRGIAGKDANSYFCVVGRQKSGATAFVERPRLSFDLWGTLGMIFSRSSTF